MDELFLNRVMPRTADMAARLSRYGFTECSTLRHFLLSACGEYPAPCALLYIRGMLRTCLGRHDDGGQWFADLRAMEQQVSRAAVDGYPGGAGPTPSVRAQDSRATAADRAAGLPASPGYAWI